MVKWVEIVGSDETVVIVGKMFVSIFALYFFFVVIIKFIICIS